MLAYREKGLFIHSFDYRLGGVQRDLSALKDQKLVAGEVDTLSAIGYRCNYGLTSEETLVGLCAGPLSSTLATVEQPRALVFQHCYGESAVLPCDPDDEIGASRNRYFPAAVIRQLGIDHLPYLCSFASGCAGFLSLLITAAGLFGPSDRRSVICVMADSTPAGFPFDMVRERILGSDQSSAFVLGSEQRGYQLLGVSYYSTTRRLVPLVEIVKRTVQMLQELAAGLGLDLAQHRVAIHYPNIFPDTWKMVTRYLRIPGAESIIDGMADRAHCGGTDSVITLAKTHRGEAGRLHVVVNYGVGLHLGVCLLKEHDGEL